MSRREDSELVGTGVFATDAQRREIEAKCKAASKTPVVSFGGGPDAASVMWHHARKFIDKCARKNGLPNMKVQYSYHRGTGEFYKPKAAKKMAKKPAASRSGARGGREG